MSALVIAVTSLGCGCSRYGTLTNPSGGEGGGVPIEIRLLSVEDDGVLHFAYVDGTEDSINLQSAFGEERAQKLLLRLKQATEIRVLSSGRANSDAEVKMWIDGDEVVTD